MYGVAKFRSAILGPLIATGGLRTVNANAALAAADFANGDIRLGTQAGTPSIGFQINGTPYYVHRTGAI